jgi:predicted metal-dependent hydrolase
MKFGDIEIDKLIRSKRRTIGLQIRSDATLIVRAPNRARIDEIEKVVIGHRRWIYKTREKILREERSVPIRKYMEGEEFPLLGRNYKLQLTDSDIIALYFKDVFFLSKKYHFAAKQAFVQWYRLRAKNVIPQRVILYAAKSNLRYGRIGITNAGRRWGSCSHKGNLNFSWRLVMAPIEAIDYVVAHELAHLEVKNHSSHFWSKVGSIYPEYEKQRKWLRENERLLTL